jgi:leader peptidase (prepilin peptidase)/N-methyltransferase
MIFLIIKLGAAVICAIGGAIAGNSWLKKLYQEKESILTFPDKIFEQSQKRQQFLLPLLVILFVSYLLTHDTTLWDNIFNLIFIYFLILFTITDFEQQVIFDVMQLPFALCGLAFCLVSGFSLLNHLTAALGGGVIFLVLAILTRGGIGGGDIKLIAALGLWLGTTALIDVVAFGFIAGGIAAFILLVFRHKKRTDKFAYGPYFTLAALLQLFLK